MTAVLARWPEGRPFAVTLTFDGGYADALDRAQEVLSSTGRPSTWFLVAGAVGGRLEGRPVAGWDRWADDPLLEVGSHTLTHPWVPLPLGETARLWRRPRALAGQVLRTVGLRQHEGAPRDPYELAGRRAGLRTATRDAVAGHRVVAWQLGRAVTSFAYPNGRFSAATARRLRACGLTSARTTLSGVNGDDVDLLALRAETWTVETTDATAAGWVDAAARTGGWLVETLHLLSASTDYYWTTTPERLATHVEDVASRGGWVASQHAAASWVAARRECTAAVTAEGVRLSRSLPEVAQVSSGGRSALVPAGALEAPWGS